MSPRSSRLLAIATVAAVAAGVAALVDRGGPWTGLIILGAAVVAGELFELRGARHAALPLSFAAFVVLDRVATVEQFVAVIVAAELVATAIRLEPQRVSGRLGVLVLRLIQASAAFAVFRMVEELLATGDERVQLIVALSVAAIFPILVADAVETVRARHLPPLLEGRSADLALVTSAILMAISARGIDGEVHLGFWGPLLFAIPLLAAWYSFERLANASKTYHQTIHALSVVPELGGLSGPGHAGRVADLCLALGREVGIHGDDLEHLRLAALLHQLGSVCLDTPAEGRHPWGEVAATSAEMLQATPALSAAGDIVAAAPNPHRPPALPYPASTVPPVTALSAQVLRVASEFDDHTRGSAEPVVVVGALQSFYAGPGYVYDARVLAALERVLRRRGLALAQV